MLVNIPRELNDLTVSTSNKLLLGADDSVYIVEIPVKNMEKIKMKEIFRWTGTNIISIDFMNDKIIAGTDRGVIIFSNNKAKPVWVGYPCNVFAGRFSDKIDIICLAKPPHKMSRILDIFAFSSYEVEFGQIKSLKGIEEEVVYFSTSIGPIQDFAFTQIKNLAVKSDIDNDGYLELIIITPEKEPKLSIIDIVDETIRRTEYELPSFVGHPILLDYKDFNEDGEKELYVVSMLSDFEAVISVLSISDNRVYASVLTKIDIRDLYGDDVSDDGLLYVFLGQFDNDGLPEIVGIWEEPSEDDGFMSKLMMFKINILGETILLDDRSLNEITIKRIIVSDIDSDSLLELIIFNESGFSIFKLRDNSGKLSVSKIYEFRLPLLIKSLSKVNNSLFITGPIATRFDSGWSLMKVNLDMNEIESVGMVPRIITLECSNEICILVTAHNKLYLIGDNCLRKVRNIFDAMLQRNALLVISNEELIRLIVNSKDCTLHRHKIYDLSFKGRLIRNIDDESIYILNPSHIISCEVKKGEVKDIKLSGHKIELKNIANAYTYREKESKYFVLILDKEVFVFNDRGNVIMRRDIMFDDAYSLLMLRGPKTHSVRIVFTRNGELYGLDLSSGLEERLNLDNVTSLRLEKETGEILVAFRNNWIAKYELEEIMHVESEESGN